MLVLNIPPPLTMTWQLTVPEAEYEQFESSELHDSSELMIDSSRSSLDESECIHYSDPYLSIDSDDNIMRILFQYSDYHNYNVYSSIVVTGYIRNLQTNIISIIPSDIINLCLSFYFEKENDFIYLSYNVYKMIHETTNNIKINYFSGKVLSSMVKNKSETNINKLCNKLIEYKFIEVVSYKTNFSSLFNHRTNK
eukprot:422048_1